jgi:hypothetical protein
VQTAKYFIQKEGDYTLPAIELKWWNLSTRRIVTTSLPAVHFVAVANPELVTELPPEPETAAITQPQPVNPWIKYKRSIEIAFASAIGIFLLVWLCRKYLPGIRNYIRTEREQRKHTEASYFRNLIRACQRNNAADAFSWLLKWISRAHSNLSLEDFLQVSHSPDLATEVEQLCKSLFASAEQTAWKGNTLATHLKAFHKSGTHARAKHIHLPPINPMTRDAVGVCHGHCEPVRVQPSC